MSLECNRWAAALNPKHLSSVNTAARIRTADYARKPLHPGASVCGSAAVRSALRGGALVVGGLAGSVDDECGK
jgi:hypothetical protein